jgi:hypothetical protein
MPIDPAQSFRQEVAILGHTFAAFGGAPGGDVESIPAALSGRMRLTAPNPAVVSLQPATARCYRVVSNAF